MKIEYTVGICQMMTEKEPVRCQYDSYSALMINSKDRPQQSEMNSVLKHGVQKSTITVVTKKTSGCCSCQGKKSASFWVTFLTNLGICTLLFGYTLLGSFIFLAIEGGASQMQQRMLASTNRLKPMSSRSESNLTFSQQLLLESREARQRTVENIWDITVSLNILYRENWTRLASSEINRFQEQIINRLSEEMAIQLDNMSPAINAAVLPPPTMHDYEWTFSKSFFYSLTVLSTIGYGSIAPRTMLGRIVTLAYALLGIPLTLIYLSSTGGMLAKVARGVFSRALCCCLCSNCGYCCYDEKRMEEKERRMKRKRQQLELRAQHITLQEPYYVRSGALHNTFHSPEKQIPTVGDNDSLYGTDSESRTSMHGLSMLAPILLCLTMMAMYIAFGAFVLYKLEDWPIIDGIYFCFMSLSTIGFGDMVPGLRKESAITIWFCSIYIMSGMALTAMCFNVLHEEIVHRLELVVEAHEKLNNSDNHNSLLIS
ncbi:TWiK family of potassium channels protein 7 [Toxorhynchites rutilus septentrionalis]|uniref:TWiK family of potassium channels protein 7 n=1 Tax=Toxorhynchites rutilus septentrionalis TaxID=329112 RepID=UPI002478D04C|nr:TWiK family of potassium channels protein 7 [Toxorhynchites rutilus septentrionalis]